MLAKRCYDHEDVDACRDRLESQLQAWDRLAASGAPELDEFEPVFFNLLVVGLDHAFAERLTPPEGCSTDALTEVRVLAASLTGDGLLTVDRTVHWRAETTVLGYRPGDRIAVRQDAFRALAKALLAELEVLVA
jgi:hypothetical protein